MGQGPHHKLAIKMQQDLQSIMELLPETKVVFSGIAARRIWRAARHPSAVNKSRIRINTQIQNFMEKNGGAVVLHKNIASKTEGLFRWDGIHFTEKGNDLFLGNIQRGLKELL